MNTEKEKLCGEQHGRKESTEKSPHQVISSFKSSYFKNSTLSGLSKLAFQYPNTLSQKGPKTLDTKTNIVEIVIN
uniref:Uncharacterized protein n=1 Tax=Salix viminalis TaxID=40686 RepID=A0A6N2K9D2_SALVM